MVGADIANIVNEAALLAARKRKKSIDTDDFEEEILEDTPVPSEQEDDEPEQEKQSSSGGDVIHCPDCEQKLKVPYERRPVRARCPACKCEFLAKKE